MTGEPVTDFWEAGRSLSYDAPLEPGDPRLVDTEAGRGHFSFQRLLRKLGVRERDDRLMRAPDKLYTLFCGHRGCGKSTELRRLARRLDGAERYFVVFLDATRELDPNSLGYADILMALAKQLAADLQQRGANVDQVFLTRLEQWFGQRIESNQVTRDFAAEVKAGAKAESGLPFVGKLFAAITNSIKTSSTYREELRTIIKNSFSEFADAFNGLIQAADEAARRAGLGQRTLFIVDGTDRLSGEDSRRFFIEDVHQLQQIQGLFIYCAPIHMLHAENQAQQHFDHDILPMIKVAERDGSRNEEAMEAMRQIVYRRLGPALFDEPETVDYLAEHSGGNPRELLRLLDYTYQRAAQERFDRPAAEAAVHDLATDYKRFLRPGDYALLHRIDQGDEPESNDDDVWHLLYNLALLEYNSFWRRSHPVVRTLDAYRRLGDG